MIPPEIMHQIETRGYLTPTALSPEDLEEAERQRKLAARREADRRRRRLKKHAAFLAEKERIREREAAIAAAALPRRKGEWEERQERQFFEAWMADPDRQIEDLAAYVNRDRGLG